MANNDLDLILNAGKPQQTATTPAPTAASGQAPTIEEVLGLAPKTAPAPAAPAENPIDKIDSTAPQLNTLYSTSTGDPVRLKYSEINEELAKGTVGYKKGTTVPMIINGESWNMPAEKVREFILQGGRIEHPHEIGVREVVAQNKGISGGIAVGLKNFADEALFGVPGIIEKHTESAYEKAKREALKEDHAIANAAGGITGFGISMLYGGELFQTATKGGRIAQKLVLGAAEEALAKGAMREGEELATKTIVNKLVEAGASEAAAEKVAPSLLRSTAANMAKYGVEGAIISAPQTITELVYDPKEAAEHLAFAVGGGAALGVLGPLGSKFGALTKDAMKNMPEIFESLKPEIMALKAAGLERGTARKFGIEKLENHGKLLLEEKVVDGFISTKEFEKRISNLKVDSGKEISDILKKMEQESASKFINERPNVGKMFDELQALRQKYSEPIYNKELKQIDRIIDTIKNRFNPEFREAIDAALAQGNKIEQTFIPLEFQETQKLKEMMGGLAKWDDTAKGELNQVRQSAYHIVRDELDDAVGRVAEKIGNPELSQQYARAKEKYAAATDIDFLLNIKDARTKGNSIFGLTDNVVGSAAGIAGAIATGNFVGGLLYPILSLTAKKFLESTYLKTGIASLMHNKNLSVSGLLFVEQAIKKSAEQLDRIPEVMQNSIKKVTPSTAGLSAMSRFVGSKTEPKTIQEKQKLFEEVSAKINASALKYQQTADRINQMAIPIGSLGAPNISKAWVEQQIKTFDYLQSILPQANKDIKPFKKNLSQISDAELASFEKALRIVDNPYNILDSFMNNTITQKEVDTLRAIYPNIYNQMVNKIAEFAYSDKAIDLPFQTRLKLSLLMGIKLDQSLDTVGAYQANFAPPPAGKGRGSQINIVTPKSNPLMTSTQLLSNRK